MIRNQGHRHQSSLTQTRQLSKGFHKERAAKSSQLAEMTVLLIRELVEDAQQQANDTDAGNDLLDEFDADLASDGAEIDEIPESSDMTANDSSFEADVYDTPVQLPIDFYWVLRVSEMQGQAQCRFYQPEWIANCRHTYKYDLTVLMNRLEDIAYWLNAHAENFLQNPCLDNWHKDMSKTLEEASVRNQKGFVAAVNRWNCGNIDKKQSAMGEDYFSRIIDKVLIVWPGKTAVGLKPLIDSFRREDNDAAALLYLEKADRPWQELFTKARLNTDSLKNELKGKDGRTLNVDIKTWGADDSLSPVHLIIKTAIEHKLKPLRLLELLSQKYENNGHN